MPPVAHAQAHAPDDAPPSERPTLAPSARDADVAAFEARVMAEGESRARWTALMARLEEREVTR